MTSTHFGDEKISAWLNRIEDYLGKFSHNRVDDVAQVNLGKDAAASQDLGDGNDVVLASRQRTKFV